jgi:peptidoglycan/LPS O-acetylase OafA/YrhL
MLNQNAVLKNIQGARALAALFVVAFHLGILPFGQCGVDVFFVISGFIMSYVAPAEGRVFLIKRLIRIVPLYWLLTVGVYTIAVVRPQWLNTTTDGFSYLLKSLFFIPYIKENGNWGPLLRNGWTLNFEMFFYLAVSLSLLLVRARFATLFSAAMLSLLCLLTSLFDSGSPILQYLSQPLIFEFCLGVACFWAISADTFGRLRPVIWAMIALGSMLAIVLLHHAYGDPVGFARVAFYGVPSFLLILSLLSLERAGFAVKSTLVASLGAASYSIYLLHPYVIGIVEKGLKIHPNSNTVNGAGSAIGIIFVVCGAGWLCHRYVENPIQSHIKRAQRPRLQNADLTVQ